MPDSPTPLDLDAIRVRADARRDYADERPESLHVPEDYAALADESAADVPALVEEVKRLRSESQRFYENRNLWQKRAEKAEAEVARLAARPAPAWEEEVVADAVLSLLPGRSEAEVKAEALREAAEERRRILVSDGIIRGPVHAWLDARADRLAAEGGADRG